jgi:hypothetical protein
MNPRRIDLVRAAFQVLDREGRGVVTMDDLMQIFDPSLHPDVKEGKITPEQCVRDFGKQWDTLERDGVITFDEFLEYYRDISAAIPMDDYFELMICNAWRMAPPGADSSAHATRVLVTFENGRSEMVEIEDDAGLGAFYTLVPIRPRRRGERRFLRTFPGASLRPPLAFNPRPRRLSTPSDAFRLHPDVRSYGTTLRRPQRRGGAETAVHAGREERREHSDELR